MVRRRLGRTEFELSPIGFGAFKIGRNQGIKYAQGYELPGKEEVSRLLNGILDLGINYIDTAPAYGLSEERIGEAIGHRKRDYVISTKVGENFTDGKSSFDFTAQGIRASIARSRKRLKADGLDIVFAHSDGNDLHIINHTDLVPTLKDLKSKGEVRAIGFSGKTPEGAAAALDWADVLMVEYNIDDASHAQVIAEAEKRGVGVVVKKGLASGKLPAAQAIQSVLRYQAIASMVIGGLNLDHIRANVSAAEAALKST
jgi:aryl-alcohol dehydrogenase-like predicted oxidoreductase